MTKDEIIKLRELAGGRCTIQKVIDAIKAVKVEREARKKVCESIKKDTN